MLANSEVSVTRPIEVHANAVLELFQSSASNVKGETITKAGGGRVELRLRGDKTNPASLKLTPHSIASILKQGFGKLYVENKALIDFSYNYLNRYSILYLDELIFSDAQSILTICGWHPGFNYLLVKKDWGEARISELLSQIYFEGEGPANTWEASNLKGFDDYWEIRPYATPEPATTGAILGAVGLGLCAWRKKYRKTGHLTRPS